MCRLKLLPDDRLTKKMFNWDKQLKIKYPNMKTWCREVMNILSSNNLSHYFEQNVNKKVLIQSLKESLFQHDQEYFKNLCLNSSMLRSYVLINYFTEPKQYLSMPLPFPLKQRFAQCRLGILPIRQHTGRYEKYLSWKEYEKSVIYKNTKA